MLGIGRRPGVFGSTIGCISTRSKRERGIDIADAINKKKGFSLEAENPFSIWYTRRDGRSTKRKDA
jgi:hypothetical protein